jgi:hypothetical protein
MDAIKIAMKAPGFVRFGDPLDMPADLFVEVADSIPEDEELTAMRSHREMNRGLFDLPTVD